MILDRQHCTTSLTCSSISYQCCNHLLSDRYFGILPQINHDVKHRLASITKVHISIANVLDIRVFQQQRQKERNVHVLYMYGQM